MKKLCLGLLLVCFFAIFTFSDDNGEEVGFLLFQPNLGNAFVNDEQASIQLDLIAQNIIGRNLGSGQINIHGYAAVADNDIDPYELSEERAVFILNELQKRGILRDLFSNPEGHGAVTHFGINEEDLMPNRRVRVLVQPVVVPPVTTVTSVTIVPGTTTVPQGSTQQFNATVNGTNNPPQTVAWSITGGEAGTSISPTGLLTVGSNQTPGSITVTAASTADTTRTGTASVTVDLLGSSQEKQTGSFKFPWWILLIIAAIVLLVYLLSKNRGVASAGSGGVKAPPITKPVSGQPSNTNFPLRSSPPLGGIGERNESEINLPPETVSALKGIGCSVETIIAISKEIGGVKDNTTFIPDINDKEFNKVCDENISYLKNPAEDEKWGNLVDPARREKLIKNYQAAKDRKLGFTYKNGKFINMSDYALRQASVRDLGLQVIPTWRYPSGAKDSDPSGRGLIGIMGLGDILVARQNNLVSDTELSQLKELCPKIYSEASPCSNDDLTRFKTLTNKIFARIPNGSYTKNMMQYHEEHDLHTLSFVPAGLHSTLPVHSDWRGLPHTGGQAVVKKAIEHIKLQK